MTKPKIEVILNKSNKYGLVVNGVEIAESKNQFDADHAKKILAAALEINFEESTENFTSFENIGDSAASELFSSHGGIGVGHDWQ